MKLSNLIKIFDILICPLVVSTAVTMRILTRVRLRRLPLSKRIMLKIGVYPIRDHYYEPRFNYAGFVSHNRLLTGINFNPSNQLSFIQNLEGYSPQRLPESKTSGLSFSYDNPNFGPDDADFWYSVVRAFKPARIIEIGSGHSTLMALHAVNENAAECPGYSCSYTCIEPYEMDWLASLPINLIRKKVEELPLNIFSELLAGDILFIDSSHIQRPGGDVLFEILSILPTLNPGVIVHIHDIFTPYEYPISWLRDDIKFWNEQYMLEAFLTQNGKWEILAGLQFLMRNHSQELQKVCRKLNKNSNPGSFYIRRIED